LHAAAHGGHVAIAMALLAKAPPINWQNTAGETALHACCASVGSNVDGRRQVAALLLRQKKLFVGQVDHEGRTAEAVAKDAVLRAMVQDALQVLALRVALRACGPACARCTRMLECAAHQRICT
jgi:ankyrin repeat protein